MLRPKPRFFRTQLAVVLTGTLCLGACTTTTIITTPQVDTQSLNTLENLNAKEMKATSDKANHIRTLGLQNTALTLAAQGGLSWRANQINTQLQQSSTQLDQIFNFNALMLNHSVMPPVLAEGHNTLNLADPNTIRIANVTYKIISQARFVTAPPTWRNYIWMDYPPPTVPNSALLPKTKDEQIIWQHYVQIGWQNGVQQANTIYSQNLGRLKQDYTGIILYRKLLAQHMVSSPFVATTDLGITGNDSELNINDQVLRITALPTLQNNSQKWQPVVVE